MSEEYVEAGTGYGYRTASWTQLPKGIKAEDCDDGRVILSGTPTEKGAKETVFTFKDEAGAKYQTTVVFMIYSEDNIIAATETEYAITKGEDKADVYGYIYIAQSYFRDLECTVIDNKYNLDVDAYLEDDVIEISGKLPVGTYDIKVKIKDKDSEVSTTATIKFVVQKGIKITGTVKDLAGNPLEGEYIYAYMSDNSPYSHRYYYEDTDLNGTYELFVPQGTFAISGDSDLYINTLYEQYIYIDRANVNLVANVYKVTVNNKIGDTTYSYSEWYDEKGEYCGYRDTLYLKPGVYKLSTKCENGIFETTATLNINVTGSMTVTPSVSIKKPEMTEFKVGDSKVFSGSEKYVYYSFKSPESGYYSFYSDDDTENDPEATIYSEEGMNIAFNDDYDESLRFKMIFYLEKDETYYFKVRSRNRYEFTMHLEKSTEDEYNNDDDDDYDY